MDISNGFAAIAIDAMSAQLNVGFIDVYGNKNGDASALGAPPANADTAITTQSLLVSHKFGSPAFAATGVPTLRQALANAMTVDAVTLAGTPRFLRITKADHVTVAYQFLVGACNAVTNAAAAKNALVLQVAALTAPMNNGDRLQVGGNKVAVLTADAAISATPVNLAVAALTDAIAAGEAVTYDILWNASFLPLGGGDGLSQLAVTLPRGI